MSIDNVDNLIPEDPSVDFPDIHGNSGITGHIDGSISELGKFKTEAEANSDLTNAINGNVSHQDLPLVSQQLFHSDASVDNLELNSHNEGLDILPSDKILAEDIGDTISDLHRIDPNFGNAKDKTVMQAEFDLKNALQDSSQNESLNRNEGLERDNGKDLSSFKKFVGKVFFKKK